MGQHNEARFTRIEAKLDALLDKLSQRFVDPPPPPPRCEHYPRWLKQDCSCLACHVWREGRKPIGEALNLELVRLADTLGLGLYEHEETVKAAIARVRGMGD